MPGWLLALLLLLSLAMGVAAGILIQATTGWVCSYCNVRHDVPEKRRLETTKPLGDE